MRMDNDDDNDDDGNERQRRDLPTARILWKNMLIESDVYRIENDISRK